MTGRVVVEWTRATLRMTVAEGGRKAKLKVMRTLPMGGQDLSLDLIKQLYRALGTPIRQCVLIIPREQVITRTVRFPATHQGELAQMVELYARAQLPYARDQMILDFAVLDQKEGFSTVALVAGQRDVIDRPLALLEQCGLEVLRVTVSSWGVAEWFRQLPKRAASTGPELVIHLDDARTDLVLMSDRKLLSSRSIGQGVLDWSDPDQVIELLAIEVERSRASLRKELSDLEVQSVWLTGMGPLAQWEDALQRRLGLPVHVAEGSLPFAPWTAPPDLGVSPVVGAGVATGDPDHFLQLTPPEVKGQVHNRRQLRDIVLAGLLTVAVIGMAAGNMGLQVRRHRTTAERLEQTIAGLSPLAKTVQEKRRATSVVNGIIAQRRHLAETLSGIFQTLPDSMSLEILGYERSKREWSLRGNAPSTQTVLEYVARLKDLPGVSAAQLKYSRQRQTPAGERTDFEVLVTAKEA